MPWTSNCAIAALEYHRQPTAGKISVTPTKGLINQRDLALAYSPGVAAACDAIVADPREARTLTSRGNLVAVITNGTAVLGLGNIGPLAGKPVMEGKGCLFKKFAGIDVFDIELDETDPDKLVKIIARARADLRRHQPRGHQGAGVLLHRAQAARADEDPGLPRRPARHGDRRRRGDPQRAQGRRQGHRARSSWSARAPAPRRSPASTCWSASASQRENVIVCDSKGVIYTGRETPMEENKARYARDTTARTLADAIDGADIFLGLSGPRVLTQDMVKAMARDPLILALANPEPEILPELAKAVRPDAIIATGRSDYPNQVNNVLCFPFIFRGALDVGATTITEEMKLACVRAIAELAHAEQSDIVAQAYAGEDAVVRPRVPDPEAVRSAADRDRAAGGRARRRWTAASPRGRSPTSTRIASGCRSSSTTPA